MRLCCVGPSSGRVEVDREVGDGALVDCSNDRVEGDGALAACKRGLLSCDLSVGVREEAVVVVCLLNGRRKVADSVTCGLGACIICVCIVIKFQIISPLWIFEQCAHAVFSLVSFCL